MLREDLSTGMCSGEPVKLQSSPVEWPIEVHLMGDRMKPSSETLPDRGITVIGASLNDHAIQYPRSLLLSNVIIILRSCSVEHRYGNRCVKYKGPHLKES